MGYPTVAIDEEIARVASGLLAAADRGAGGDSGVETNDAYIGAVVNVLGESVLTANVVDFQRLGVETTTY
jgi:predicted nucleic acid-binding protein